MRGDGVIRSPMTIQFTLKAYILEGNFFFQYYKQVYTICPFHNLGLNTPLYKFPSAYWDSLLHFWYILDDFNYKDILKTTNDPYNNGRHYFTKIQIRLIMCFF